MARRGFGEVPVFVHSMDAGRAGPFILLKFHCHSRSLVTCVQLSKCNRSRPSFSTARTVTGVRPCSSNAMSNECQTGMRAPLAVRMEIVCPGCRIASGVVATGCVRSRRISPRGRDVSWLKSCTFPRHSTSPRQMTSYEAVRGLNAHHTPFPTSMSTMAARSRNAARCTRGAAGGAAVAGDATTGVAVSCAATGSATACGLVTCGAASCPTTRALVTVSVISDANVASLVLCIPGVLYRRSQSHGTSLLSTETSPGPA